MKGRKGGEGPQVGVAPTTAPPPSTNGSRIMAAAKRRKRGGAVKSDFGPKIEGKEAPKRLDKPRRARGGGVDSNIARQTSKANSQLADMMSKRKASPTPPPGDGEGALKSIEKKLGRARGGKVGADTKPFTHAKTTKATKGHSTEANIT